MADFNPWTQFLIDLTPKTASSHAVEVRHVRVRGHTVLQGDGYAGYDKTTKDHPELVVAGCLDHAWRKIHDAYLFKDPNAAWLLQQLGRVYDVERQAKTEGLGPDELLVRRRTISRPVLEKAYVEVGRWQKTALRDAFLRKALTYLCNQKSKLLAFLDDSRIPLSNTHVERLLKSVVLVRKDSLFCGAFAGAKRFARYMTLVANCKIGGCRSSFFAGCHSARR